MAPFAPEVAIALFLAVAGTVLYVTPRRQFRTAASSALALGVGLATARYLGIVPGLVVALVGVIVARILDTEGDQESPPEPTMRLLLVGFVVVATASLAAGRPMGRADALDLNAAWYWTGALGLLILLSERSTLSMGLGGALIAGAVGLAVLHLVPQPGLGVWAAAAVLPVSVAVAARLASSGPE